ncbi:MULTISPECIES: toprim domain-containing protein [unclassified Mesorhizobium]|uniref:DUF7146 domain-containing protein n=1 Tax=unclassified Mesorhizobium TaxID=325217 RepID=UPI000FCA168F|nr:MULTISPECIES: toprim domain-containing protein [unclassified Mesorhizobium]RUV24871.1 hypothetical protein EOA91_10410 [Mesorhizobium sp. M1A.F.Ca.IN.022.04.1.1]RWG33361.1 MAG: hypothetical protein EOQ60_11675 [Mesorhizobium sp.]
MTAGPFSFNELFALAGGLGCIHVVCPLCGSGRRDPKNRLRRVLRLYSRPGFVGFICSRCETKGFVLDGDDRQLGATAREEMRRVREAMAERDAIAAEKQRWKASWLWSMRQPIRGTPAERYLREARCISCPLPATLAFLPARENHPPALIAAFAVAADPEIADTAILGVHLTRLRPDGSDKAGEPAKIMIGRSKGAPIVLAAPNDLLGLAVAEGIEDALSAHQATGLGAWAAGSASRLEALGPTVPDWMDCVSVLVDNDEVGKKGATRLASALYRRGIHAELVEIAGSGR